MWIGELSFVKIMDHLRDFCPFYYTPIVTVVLYWLSMCVLPKLDWYNITKLKKIYCVEREASIHKKIDVEI